MNDLHILFDQVRNLNRLSDPDCSFRLGFSRHSKFVAELVTDNERGSDIPTHTAWGNTPEEAIINLIAKYEASVMGNIMTHPEWKQ